MKAYHLRAAHLVFVAFLAIAMLGYSAPAYGRGYGNKYTKPSNEQNQQSTSVPPVDTTAASQAQENLNKARQAEQQAEDNLNTVTSKLRTDFNNSPEMVAANQDLKESKDAYDKSSKPILDKLHDGDEYRAAQTAHDQDEEKLTALRSSNGASDEISSTAMDALAQSSTMTKLENSALASDSQTASAKSKMSQAGAKIAALQAKFNASLTQNTEWSAAKKALDDAKQNLDTASASMRDASNNQAAQQAAHNAAAAKQQQQQLQHPNTSPPANNPQANGN